MSQNGRRIRRCFANISSADSCFAHMARDLCSNIVPSNSMASTEMKSGVLLASLRKTTQEAGSTSSRSSPLASASSCAISWSYSSILMAICGSHELWHSMWKVLPSRRKAASTILFRFPACSSPSRVTGASSGYAVPKASFTSGTRSSGIFSAMVLKTES